MNASRYDRYVLCIILGGTFVLYALVGAWLFTTAAKAGVPAQQVVVSGGDATDYVALAHTLIADGRFALTSTSSPEFFRLPGYPFFLAILFSLTSSIYAIPVVQTILIGYCACLVYLLGKRYFTPGIGIVAAAVFVIDPTTIFLAMAALTEVLYVALTLSAVWLIGVESRRPLAHLSAGLLIGMSLLVRPVGIYLVPVYALFAVAPWRGWRVAAVSACVFLIGVFLVVVPWSARNYSLSGHIALTSQSAYNILFYNVVDFENYRTGVPEDVIKAQIDEQIGNTDNLVLRSFTYAPQEAALDRAYLEPVLPQYAYFHLVRTLPFFFGSSIESRLYILQTIGVLPLSAPTNISDLVAKGNLQQAFYSAVESPAGLLERIFWIAVALSAFIYALATIYNYKESRNAAFVAFSIALIGILALITGPIAETRYRMPAEPFLLFLAFAGFAALIQWWKRSRV